jgi:phosphoribosyl 1,2-cyclic phosphate phosphodiesterase
LLRVTLLGTGGSAGVPMIGGRDGAGQWGNCDPKEPRNRRSRASIVIEQAGFRLLVDTPPDMRAQLLACRVPRVDAILYTHSHADHITGLDDVRILNRIVNRPIAVYLTAATLEELERRFDYAFRPWQPPNFFRPVMDPILVAPGETVAAGPMAVQLFDQDHGYGRTLGLRVGGFAYSTDAVRLDGGVFNALAGLDTWVVGCFQRAPAHKTHATLLDVLEWVERAHPRRAVLTHMGPDMDWHWLAANLPPGVEAGFDGMVLDVPE